MHKYNRNVWSENTISFKTVSPDWRWINISSTDTQVRHRVKQQQTSIQTQTLKQQQDAKMTEQGNKKLFSAYPREIKVRMQVLLCTHWHYYVWIFPSAVLIRPINNQYSTLPSHYSALINTGFHQIMLILFSLLIHCCIVALKAPSPVARWTDEGSIWLFTVLKMSLHHMSIMNCQCTVNVTGLETSLTFCAWECNL